MNTPNLYWNAISDEHLRSSLRYQALPQTQHVIISDIHQYRWVPVAVLINLNHGDAKYIALVQVPAPDHGAP